MDRALFERLRADVRAGRCAGPALLETIHAYVGGGPDPGGRRGEMGYDVVDSFVNGLLLVGDVPPETGALEPEMVHYQQTPARVILELAGRAALGPEDVFFDVGSGLGQVPILVNLLSGAAARGVEFEPAYCEYARTCAAELRLSRVEFIQEDARAADYSGGTAFFMYTPFGGRMLRDVLERLRREARERRIRLFTYGPCTLEASRQPWLERAEPGGLDASGLAAFASL